MSETFISLEEEKKYHVCAEGMQNSSNFFLPDYNQRLCNKFEPLQHNHVFGEKRKKNIYRYIAHSTNN